MISVTYVVTKGRWGGASRYVYDLATGLPWQKFKVQVIIGEGEDLPERLKKMGIKVIRLPMLSRNVNWWDDWANLWHLRRIFKRDKSDIVHLNSSKAGLLGALAGRLARGPKIIFTAHGWAFNEERSRWARLGIKFLHWLTVLLCHQTIAVSEITKQQLVNWPKMREKMAMIHNGISAVKFRPPGEARRELLGQNAAKRDGLWLGAISELHKNKGLSYLLSAVRILQRLNLDRQGLTLTMVIIGEGEERKNLETQIRQLGLEQTVFLVGQRHNAAALLSAFDIFTLTSITEAFPYAVLEAGAAGLPVLATAVGGVPEIIESMKSGVLVKPRQPAEIARALQFLIQEPSKRQKFGRQLRQKVRREFSTVRMVKQTINIYNSVHEANEAKRS